jgi:hypothetical protein
MTYRRTVDPIIALARHYRHDHGWGIRRISRALGLTEREVHDAVDPPLDFGGVA